MPGIPFAGGALGYWSYDLARRAHRLPALALDAENLPDMALGIYDWALVIDHQELNARLVSRQRHAETAQVLAQILERLKNAAFPAKGRVSLPFNVSGKIASNLSPETYRTAFNVVQQYLRDGDCYQVNLAQRYTAKAEGDAFAAYLELRRLSPAPYSAFLDWPDVQILCASPERFLQVQQGRVETKPIKGTRARNADAAEDARLAQELSQHPKDRAENLMIVDLLRNDLGKSCEPGTVRVPKLFEVESYSNVHHLVSTVEGSLRSGRGATDVLRDCFPGGSITGAPKQRAMEIIEQLEPNRRGVYCGVIGYVGYDGNMDSNIAIRTLVYSNREIRCWAGGGIVADSNCAAEYQETLDKAAAMLDLLRRFGGEVG
jgi:para-aminobenzoate synthetase component 1